MAESSVRNMVFLSHAWEDYEFAKFLSLKLANEGYGVWCDLTKLLGGENWPLEINEALQSRTQKFLFVLSRTSNMKDNPLGELQLAIQVNKSLGIKNFIVPLRIDDIKYDEIDFRFQNIQTVPFVNNWAQGLAQLLELLERDKVLKNPSFDPDAVNRWWLNYGTNASKVINSPEYLYSNRYPLQSFPENIYAHFVDEKPRLHGEIKYPIVPFRQYLLSFADARALEKEQGIRSKIVESNEFRVGDILGGKDPLINNPQSGEYYVTRLLNQGFEKGLKNKGLKSFKLSIGICSYFHEKLLSDGRIIFKSSGNLDPRIKLWGKAKTETWYFAIRARLEKAPGLHYLIQPHILAKGNRGLRAAPKGVYKSWRNDKWRDRLKASVAHISEDGEEINLQVGDGERVRILSKPIEYISPVSYEEPQEQLTLGEGAVDD